MVRHAARQQKGTPWIIFGPREPPTCGRVWETGGLLCRQSPSWATSNLAKFTNTPYAPDPAISAQSSIAMLLYLAEPLLRTKLPSTQVLIVLTIKGKFNQNQQRQWRREQNIPYQKCRLNPAKPFFQPQLPMAKETRLRHIPRNWLSLSRQMWGKIWASADTSSFCKEKHGPFF